MRIAGIDAGGTKTDFMLCDENEAQIKRVTLGAGNPNDIGIDACIALLTKGLDELCADHAPDAVFAGVSGGGYGENAQKIREFLQSRFPNAAVDNGTDAINLIYCSHSDGNVGALICGTGNALFVRRNSELLRFGGWGHLFDNGGSAYDVGKTAISYLLLCEETDPEELSSPMCALLREKLGSSAHDALNSIYAKGKTYIASFAPLVFEADLQGDMAARRIIDMNVELVADRLTFVNSSVGPLDEVVCAGGLFNSPLFFKLLLERTQMPLSLLTLPPVYGACRRAISLV